MIQCELTTYNAELIQIVAAVFDTMMGLESKPVEAVWSVESHRVAASVHFAGSFRGMLLLEVTPAQACFMAGRFLSSDPPDTMDNDVRDVLGELANMIGGNLKGLIDPEAALSIPEVVDGRNLSIRVCGLSVVDRLAFQCEAGVFWVSLIQPQENAAF